MKIIDKLVEVVRQKGGICVGLDSSLDYIPQPLKDHYPNVSDQIFEFNKAIIDATSDIVAIYKPQIAYYEANGIEGLMAYARTLRYLRENRFLSIGDVKRSDIASTATQYAQAHFTKEFEADFITLNPYMGFDSITPYLPYLRSGEKGIFVLLRTSNPGAKDIEYLKVEDEYLYYKIGDQLQHMSQEFIGESGYSALGLVTGGTHRDEAQEIRQRYPSMFFLIPGYGAQGATAADVRLYLNDQNGGIINSSRGIITHYKKFEDGPENFAKYAREAVLAMRKDIYEV